MAAAMLFYYHLFALVIAFSAFIFLLQAEHSGFHVDLIHRDSPNSPFFSPSETHSGRLINALQRSISRVNYHFKPILASISPDTAQSTIVPNHGEYLMEISIGTPPVKVLGIADTGSDLTWTQCKPCAHCYEQNEPLFSPKASSSYREVSCNTGLCQSLGGSTCMLSNSTEICHYSITYGDRSYTHGTLAWETFMLGSTNGRPISFPHTAFGCGFENNGTFAREGSGIIGLGQGQASLISRIRSSIGGKFSYCLVPFHSRTEKPSRMNFGSKSLVSGPGVVSTPLSLRDNSVFYFLTLEAISVGDKRLEYSNYSDSSPNVASTQGNIIIDSGTTLTILPEEFYVRVESEVIEAIKGVARIHDPSLLPLCYLTRSDDFGAPAITAHFTNTDVKLHDINAFVRVTEDVMCFAFAYSAGISFSIFGNLAQMNFLVGYDLEQKTVSFKQADCTQQE